MIRYQCRHCGAELEAPASAGGEDVRCPSCSERTIVPRLVARRSNPPTAITVCLLVSAIANIVVGLAWAATCFGIVFTIPMVLLCIFEFILYGKASGIPPERLAAKATRIGIFEIIVGLANTVTLICGIIVLIHASKLSRLESAPSDVR